MWEFIRLEGVIRVEELKGYLKRRIKHAQKRVNMIEEKHGSNPSKDYNYHGGMDLGMWKGLLTGYENTLDEIEVKE